MKTIKETVEQYVEGTKTGNVDLLRGVFAREAIMSGDLGDKKLVVGSPEMFFNDIAGKSVAEDYDYEIKDIHQYGEIGIATLKEYNLMGGDFINHYQLQRIEGHWKIISKLFTTA